MSKAVRERERIVVRFAGDSGDGMQLTGDRFTSATAVLGNDLATLPDFPAEIRAPAGTVHGVSAFQIQFASSDITTPGDHADVLIAMNPAALKADLETVAKGGVLVLNEDSFTQRNVEKAGYTTRSDAGRDARRVPGLQGADDVDHGASHRGHRDREEGGRAGEEHVRPRPRVVDVRPSDRDHAQLAGEEVRLPAGDPGCERRRVQGGIQLRRDDGALRRVLQGGRGAPGARDLPEHRGGDGARVGTDRRIRAERAPALLRELSRSPRPRSSSTSSRGTRTSASSRSRRRTRSPRRTSRWAPPSAASSRSPGRAGPASTSRPRRSGWR